MMTPAAAVCGSIPSLVVSSASQVLGALREAWRPLGRERDGERWESTAGGAWDQSGGAGGAAGGIRERDAEQGGAPAAASGFAGAAAAAGWQPVDADASVPAIAFRRVTVPPRPGPPEHIGPEQAAAIAEKRSAQLARAEAGAGGAVLEAISDFFGGRGGAAGAATVDAGGQVSTTTLFSMHVAAARRPPLLWRVSRVKLFIPRSCLCLAGAGGDNGRGRLLHACSKHRRAARRSERGAACIVEREASGPAGRSGERLPHRGGSSAGGCAEAPVGMKVDCRTVQHSKSYCSCLKNNPFPMGALHFIPNKPFHTCATEGSMTTTLWKRDC